MITEKGSIKVATEHNANMNKELNKTTIILGIAYAVLGGIILLTSTIIYIVEPLPDVPYIWLILGTVLFIFGLTICGSAKNINKLNGVNTKVEESEFFTDYLINREYENGEHLVTAKIYYSRLIKVKETKNYLFLYNTRVTAVAVDKNKLTEQELNGIRSLLGRPISGAAAYVNFKPEEKQTAPETQESTTEGQAENTTEEEQKASEEISVEGQTDVSAKEDGDSQ
ncbi:MAG: YcxB family protein [Candidatus Coproplasma sp.]